MIISIIQPCFIPWLGYFEQIEIGDVFVYLDDVQYTKKDWRNRNKLKTAYGIKNIHVPVQKTNRDTLIKDVLISYNEPWQKNIENKLTEWYKKSPYFNEVMELITPLIHTRYEKLVELNYHLNLAIMNYMGIHTPIRFSSEVPKNTDDKNLRIIEICQYFNADVLYDGKSAQNFIDTETFRQQGIEIIFQDYQHTPYQQLHDDFVPYMSVIDLIMNEGKQAKSIIMSSPLPNKISYRL